MFHLHHADELDPLLESLADLLAAPPDDPFTPDVLVVPTAGLADYAMAGLGHRLGATSPDTGDGVVANVEFMFPGRFLALALGDPVRAADSQSDPWQLSRLTWAVLEELVAGSVDVPTPSDDGADQWALARHIADLFDRYSTQRPRMIEAWAAGDDVDGSLTGDGEAAILSGAQLWQAQLWRAVRSRIGVPSPPERLPGLLAALRSGEVQPALPQRVSLFGAGSIAPTMLAVLSTLGEVRDVHVFLRHSSRTAWASSPHLLGGSLMARNMLDIASHTTHPLVASWGRPPLETRALIGGLTDVAEHSESIDVNRATEPTLLRALQNEIRLDQRPTLQPGLDAADGSLQVHACHGEVRQLEVLRDALGHVFVADPTLAAHDVVVLCPDLERFAPLVEAVFDRGPLPVPVRIGDRSLTTDDPLTGALQALLGLVSGRASLSEVLAFVQFEPVRTRLGWSINDVEQLASWCTELGTHWGLSPEHRTAWGLPDTITTGTWRGMVDQLLAGTAMSAPTPRVVLGSVVPYDDLGSDDLELVGTLADLLARLVDLHVAVQHSRPVAEWVELLHEMLDTFCEVDDDQAWRLQRVHRELDAIATSAQHGDSVEETCDIPLAMHDIRALLGDSIADRPGHLSLRSGAVTVSSLVPQHGVPARIVCLLGLDDGALRAGTFDGDDVLGAHPCIGERHPRFRGRQVLLDAVLAARDRLIITCNGADITTNHDTPLIVPLVELLDVVGETVELDERGAPVVVHHPRHGFNEATLQPGALVEGADVSFTFDRSMLDAAEARRVAEDAAAGQSASSDSVESPWSLPQVPFDAAELGDLVEAIVNPSKVYLRQRLNVHLPGEAEHFDDGLSIAVDPLRKSQLGRDLLGVRRHGEPIDEWTAIARLDGSLPPGELSTAALAAVSDEVAELEAVADTWGVPLAGTDEVVIEQLVPSKAPADQQADLRLTGAVAGTDGARLVNIRFARPKPSHLLALAMQLAAVQRQQPDTDWSGVLISRGSSERSKPTANGLRIRGSGAEQLANAERMLTLGADLFAWSRRDAVPLFDETSPLLVVGDLAGAYKAFDDDRKNAQVNLLWADASLDSLLLDSIVATDPPWLSEFADPDHPDSRAVAVARWVWQTFDDTTEETDASGQPVQGDEGDAGGDAA